MEMQGERDAPCSTSGDEGVQDAMEKQVASSVSAPPLPELRLVLLGRKGVGKSAAANTILGGKGGFESGRPTEECSKRKTDLTGRRIIVVDTPGWEWYYPLNRTPEWVRRETLRSVSLCPPGPHVVLLVVRSCASVTESYRREIEEHLEALGKGVLDHTMLLFTRGDELGVVPMEQRILTGGAAFQQLLKRCGNRYHVLDNRSRGDANQVKELLKKMEAMVEANEGRHFGASLALLGLEADGKRRARERRKRQRQMEAQTQSGTMRAALMSDAGSQGSEWDGKQLFSKGTRRLPELRLVLLGERETGKSSTGNTILGIGAAGFFQAGKVTEECVRCQAEVAMRLVTVVDTPGWEGGVAGPTPERVKREMVWGSMSLCLPGPHALLLTLRVDTLVSSTPVREHLELLGEGVWRHTILLFTHGDQLRKGVAIEQHIQSGGRDLQWLVEKCGNRYHVISNVDGCGDPAQVSCLLEKVEKMVAGNRCEAFSSLVQEVCELTRQRNDKFNQRLKELSDKIQRQDAELKSIREREMKSIRWFFERKKKVKSPGKLGEEKLEDGVEEEWKRTDGRKNEMSDLEERMRWLTEDKEREIQDLGAENYRLIAALNQMSRERDRGVVELEEKEREIEELKERVDEQQAKLLDLEHAAAERERENHVREEDLRGKHQEWRREVEELKDRIDMEMKEKEEWKDRLKVSQKLMYDLKKLYEEKISHHEKELEELRLLSKTRETTWRDEQRKRDEREQREMGKLREIIEIGNKEITQARQLIIDKDKEIHEASQRSVDHIKEIEWLKDNNETKQSEIEQIQQQFEDYKRTKDAETRDRLEGKELELNLFKQKDQENKSELDSLRQTINQTKADLENLTAKMEKEMTNMIQEYEKEIKSKEEEVSSTLVEKQKAMGRLLELDDENKRNISVMNDHLLESQRTVEELQERNASMKKEVDNLKEKCEQYEREQESQRTKNENREAEVRRLLSGYEEKLRNKDIEILSVLKKRDLEVTVLKETEYERCAELEKRKMEQEATEKKLNEMRQCYEKRLKEINSELERRDEENNKELERRERLLDEKEQEQGRKNEDLDKQGTYNDVTPGRTEDAYTMYQEVGVVEKHVQDRRREDPERNGSISEMGNQMITESASFAILTNNSLFERMASMEDIDARPNLEEQVKKAEQYKDTNKMLCQNEGDSKSTEESVLSKTMRDVSPDPSVANTNKIPRSELRLVVLKEAWSPRHPAGETLLGSETIYLGESVPLRGEIAGRKVSVLEPHGLTWRNGPPNNTTEPPEFRNIVQSQPGPHAIILVIPAYLSFTQKYRRAVVHNMSVLGEDIWHRTIVLFTWGEALGESAEQHILRNGDLQWLVEQCAGRYHVLDSWKNQSQTTELMEKIEKMVAGNEGYQYYED
ncbi:hypothetical protein UPYG_G00237780 [Umbra pygmaea]|uniref:AIG1-type G domain-containing protein n=1 Tax=Umbra pygmaea TaxID=75934 RepID=A0ABD0WYX0_UMBPY